MNNVTLVAKALTADDFQPFGEVIESTGNPLPINAGSCDRFNDLANIDVSKNNGRAGLAIFCAQPHTLPHKVSIIERHPLSSQAFFPIAGQRFLIVVAPAELTPSASSLSAFVSNGRQGVNYAPGVWHHPLITLDQAGEFIVIDRLGPGRNCDEIDLSEQNIMVEIT